MKTYRIETFSYTNKTNFRKCKTILGCYRDKWSHSENNRFTYFVEKIEDNIKYIVFNGVKNVYMQRRSDMFISKFGNFPKSMNKGNTLVKKLNA